MSTLFCCCWWGKMLTTIGDIHKHLIRGSATGDLIFNAIKKDETYLSTKDENGSIALHFASMNIHITDEEVFTQLIANFPDGTQIENNFGDLPLHKACDARPKNDLGIIDVDNFYALIEATNADAMLKQNKKGETPLHVAVRHPHASTEVIVRILLDETTSPAEVADNYGHLPLHIAVSKGKTKIKTVEHLLESFEAACAVKDNCGFTPLHWAVSRDEPNVAIVEALLRAHPLAVFVRDTDGLTPIDRLMVRGEATCKETMALLMAAKAAHIQSSKAFALK